jgi:uncharacterized protein
MPITTRIAELDIIRGIALFGILIVNMGLFSFPALYTDPLDAWPDWTDQLMVMLINFVGEGKFISMFSFLFGLGFMIFIARAEKKEQRAVRLFIRRLFILLLIGLVHSYFIWYGDVLCVYSVAGLFLLFFRTSRPKTVLIWAFSLLLIPVFLFLSAGFLIGPAFFAEAAIGGIPTKTIAAYVVLIYQKGTVGELFLQNNMDSILTKIGYCLILPQIFAMFLFGTYAGKQQIFSQLPEHLGKIRTIFLVSLTIGLPVALAGLGCLGMPHDSAAYNIMQFLGSYIGGSALGIFYVCAVLLLLQKASGQRILAPFAAVGRMAATNYILQSVICVLFFYSFGLGLYGKTSPVAGFFLAIGLYIFQVFFSNFWMSRFLYGPIEWLWRSLTYGKKMPIKMNAIQKQRRA